jgi:putative component of membrane protein insertase Oxa1/YidC/SpoIIIJ protein YidD
MADYEFNIDEALRPRVERQLCETTHGDSAVGALPLPSKPFLVKAAVGLLRLFPRLAPIRLRGRCVFEPSCSHYSELVFQQAGFWKGLQLTFSRLRRCGPNAGGVDYSFLSQGSGECNTR